MGSYIFNSQFMKFVFIVGALNFEILCFNCWWLRSSGVQKKVLFGASSMQIFCFLLRLKSWRARAASCHPASMVLLLIKGKQGGESTIFFCYPRGWRDSPQIYCKRGGIILCVICR